MLLTRELASAQDAWDQHRLGGNAPPGGVAGSVVGDAARAGPDKENSPRAGRAAAKSGAAAGRVA